MAITRQEEANENKIVLLSNQLKQMYQSFKQLLEIKSKHATGLQKLPAALIVNSLGNFQNYSDIAHLAQANRLFNTTLSQKLHTEKEKQKQLLNEESEFNKLFKEINPYGKLHIGVQKAYALCRLITKFRKKKDLIEDEYVKLILEHAYDLDKENSIARQLGGYEEDTYGEERTYFPYFLVEEPSSGQHRLNLKGLKLSYDDLECLAETYHKHYPKLYVVHGTYTSPEKKEFAYIDFDLESFLKDVLPVILGLAPKPVPSRVSLSLV